MLPNVGMGELIIILLVILLLFGAKRLPELAKSLGRSIRHFKEGMNDITNSSESDKSVEKDEKK